MPSCSHQSEMVRRWVRAGKQVGLSFSFEHEGATWWGTVAVQIWGVAGHHAGTSDIVCEQVIDPGNPNGNGDPEVTAGSCGCAVSSVSPTTLLGLVWVLPAVLRRRRQA